MDEKEFQELLNLVPNMSEKQVIQILLTLCKTLMDENKELREQINQP